jgi:tetratricopeptide (TPR) repeat protein
VARKKPRPRARVEPDARVIPPSAARPRRSIGPDLLIGLLLIVAILAAYWPVQGFGFVNYDDPAFVTDNSHVRPGLTWESIRWAFTSFYTCNWHPLTWLSLMLDVSLFGVNPAAHHIVSVIIHILSALLLFGALRIMTSARWPSALVAALFALHPLHVESVAWIAERKDVLSGLFWMATLLAYAHYARKPGRRRMSLVVFACTLGLLAKPMAVTLPAVLLLIDFWPLGRITFDRGALPRGLRQCFVEKLPLFALVIVSCVVTLVAQRQGGAVVPFDIIPFFDRLANGSVAYVKYLGLTVWPAGLAVYYPHARGTLPLWQSLLALLGLLFVSAAAFKWRCRFPYLLAGWLWYLGTLVPVIGLVQVGDQALADRYTYVPLIGIFIIAAWALRDFSRAKRVPAIIIAPLCVAVLSALAIRTSVQAHTWRDSVTLFKHDIEVAGDSFIAHKNLGVALADDYRNFDEAADHCQKAISLNPNDADVYYNLGNALFNGGKTDDAVIAFRAALSLNPALVNAYDNLGNALASRHDFQEAISVWSEELRLDPGEVGAMINIGNADCMLEKYAEAIPYYEKALEKNPGDLGTWCNMGFAYQKIGDIQKAADAFRQALRIDPNSTRASEALSSLESR